jgi:hypothetical protein
MRTPRAIRKKQSPEGVIEATTSHLEMGLLAPGPLRDLSLGFVDRYQLGHQTHEYSRADAQDGFQETI